jgi:hypothetical protein
LGKKNWEKRIGKKELGKKNWEKRIGKKIGKKELEKMENLEEFEIQTDKINIDNTKLLYEWINEKEGREILQVNPFPPTYIIRALKSDLNKFLKDNKNFYLSEEDVQVSFHLNN